MLVLTRKSNQSIMIGDDIEVSVLAIMGEKVRIGIQAPRDIPVFRKEVYLEIQQERLGSGKGARELTGLGDTDVMGREANEVLGLDFSEDGADPIGTALEWGVRVLDKPVTVHAEGDRPERAKADIFPAYDDDGGLLLVLTPATTTA